MDIRPVSDLRNKFPEIEETVLRNNAPVYLTKNGYGTMVLLSLEQYEQMKDEIERKLDEADAVAASNPVRYSHEAVFGHARKQVEQLEVL